MIGSRFFRHGVRARHRAIDRIRLYWINRESAKIKLRCSCDAELHMTTDPQKIKPDRTDDDRPSPRRTVRVVAYGLFALLWLSLPILLYALYNQTKDEAAPRTKLWKYSDLHQIDIATFLADPLREGGHLVPLLDVLARGEHRGQAVRWVTNSKGYRNDSEFAYEVPEGTYRILLMGDSYVDGFRTDQERTIGYLLERHLNNTRMVWKTTR